MHFSNDGFVGHFMLHACSQTEASAEGRAWGIVSIATCTTPVRACCGAPSPPSLRGTRILGVCGADQDPESKYEALEKYARDLTQAARDGKLDPVIGRDDEVRRCVQILSRRTKNNPVLIGEPGVGKTAVAEALAQRIVAGDVPAALEGRTLMSLDMGALIAGVFCF